MKPVKLLRRDLDAMFKHAKSEYPSESCGVIIGDLDDPAKNRVRPCANIQNKLKEKYPDTYERGADTGYFMDPKDVRLAFEDANSMGLEVIGFYHSHPDHDAYWSDEDHKAAMWAGTDEPSFPEASNVVISIKEGEVKDVAIFTWNADEKSFVKSGI